MRGKANAWNASACAAAAVLSFAPSARLTASEYTFASFGSRSRLIQIQIGLSDARAIWPRTTVDGTSSTRKGSTGSKNRRDGLPTRSALIDEWRMTCRSSVRMRSASGTYSPARTARSTFAKSSACLSEPRPCRYLR